VAQADTGIYSWVRDALMLPLGNGKIPAAPTWRLYLLEDGGYTPSFSGHEAFSVIGGAVIVASQTVLPGTFSSGSSVIPDVTFPLLTGPAIGGVVLTVSGSIERLYAHWGKANDGLPFTPDGTTKKLTGLTLLHRTLIT
jgi:hypothetical protein